MPTASAVEVADLHKRYGATSAVDGVSFVAPAASVTAVLGRNGAGKTTTVDICAGLRRADSGQVRVFGHDPRDPRLRPRVGVMPQAAGSGAAGVYPAARAGEVLRHFAAIYRHPLDPDTLLDRLGLTAVARTPWRRLSGGEQQRLSLALAVVGRPELVFLDEPTAGLDVQARRDAWTLVRDLRAAGVSVVLTTHAMDEAEDLADHIVILRTGHVVAAGPADTLTTARPGLTFDAAAGLPLEGLISRLPAGTAVRADGSGHYVVDGAVDPSLVATVTTWCAEHGVLAERLVTGRRSLEDVFLDVTSDA